MTALTEIERFCGEVGRQFHPQRIILFGSYASGKAREDSDVDLLIEMEHAGSGLRTAAEIIRRLKPSFGLDLIIRSEREITSRLEQADSFISDILKHGRVVYETADR